MNISDVHRLRVFPIEYVYIKLEFYQSVHWLYNKTIIDYCVIEYDVYIDYCVIEYDVIFTGEYQY